MTEEEYRAEYSFVHFSYVRELFKDTVVCKLFNYEIINFELILKQYK